MRIALLHYTAPPIPGGVEAIIGEHARLLAAAGHEVRIVAGRGDAEIVREIDSRHPAVEALADGLARGEVDQAGYERLAGQLTAQLGPLLADRDVVVAHNVLTMPFNLPLATALGNAGRPLVGWTHDIAWVNPRYAAYQREGWPFELLRRPLAGALYVAISELRARELAEVFSLPAGSVPVIPNGIDVERFLAVDPDTRALLARARLDRADPLLLVPLRVTPRKRLELAIETAAELVGRHPRLRVCVSGPLGPHAAANREYWDQLSRLRSRLGLDDVVVFLHELATDPDHHPVSGRMIADLYRLADCVLIPSESEGFGLPVIEAALARVPVVCADIPVLREAGGEALHLFPPGASAPAIAAVVEAALAEPLARDRRRVLGRSSWDALLPEIERVLARAAEGARA